MIHLTMGMPLYLMAFYGSIMIVLVLLLRFLFKDKLPKFVFPILWCMILIRLLIPFSLSSPITLKQSISLPWQESWNVAGGAMTAATENIVEDTSSSSASDAETAVAYASESGFGSMSSLNRGEIVMILYALGIIITISILLYQIFKYSRILKDSLLVEHNETINTILREMNMGHILVFTNDHILSPLVCGLLHPRIYLPSGMEFNNTLLLKHIFKHETIHIKRKDNWLKAVMLMAICLHWYNPLVWLMSKVLSADIETACDTAVIGQLDSDERKSYAASLLAMAITGNRQTLLYSAFSKTEVERRIKGILRYKKASFLVLVFSAFLLFSCTTVLATGIQAPFSEYLSSYCGSGGCKWEVQAGLSRDIALGRDSQKRANQAIFDAMNREDSDDSVVLQEKVLLNLSKEFGVEKSAFELDISLNIDEETRQKEYESYGITKNASGYYLYKGEAMRIFDDLLGKTYQSWDEGEVDVSIVRDRMGEISKVTVLRKGDRAYDEKAEN